MAIAIWRRLSLDRFHIRMLALAALICILAFPAHAQEDEAQTSGLPVGTTITLRNWRQYRAFMPEGLQAFFSGRYHWKFPVNFRLEIGPAHHYPFPGDYEANTEKYSQQVRIVRMAGGEHTIQGYVAGLPFPNPQEPAKGYKLLVDVWYTYIPRVMCGWMTFHFEDRFNNISTEELINVYRRLAHISDSGAPTTDPQGQGIDYAEYVMVLEPEQSKYTVNLQLYYTSPAKPEDTFLFIPALRRSLRLSSAARCSPIVGTDYTQDDSRYSVYNAGIVRMDAKFLRDQDVIALLKSSPALYTNFVNYYPNILFPRPVIGKWELRHTRVIDARRIPSQRAGYCYGKRAMYVDKEFYQSVWTDLYDQNEKLWKAAVYEPLASPIPGEGDHPSNQFIGGMYDLQNSHVSMAFTGDAEGHVFRFNEQCGNYLGQNFNDVRKYSSVAGLNQIMR